MRGKKLLSVLILVAMLVNILPIAALAEDAQEPEQTAQEFFAAEIPAVEEPVQFYQEPETDPAEEAPESDPVIPTEEAPAEEPETDAEPSEESRTEPSPDAEALTEDGAEAVPEEENPALPEEEEQEPSLEPGAEEAEDAADSEATEEEDELEPAAEDEQKFIQMNIPYTVFYSQIAGSTNAYEIDAITSATGKKAAYFWDGSYKGNTPVAYGEGQTIKGVAFPLQMSASDIDRLNTDLGAGEAWHYTVLETEPLVYASASVSESGSVVLGSLNGPASKLSGATATLDTSGKHGDYLIKIANDGGVLSAADKATFVVYGAVIQTSDGEEYDLYHLENLYYNHFNELAFSTESSVNQKGQTAHKDYFAGLEGETISQITYITNAGILFVPLDVQVMKPMTEAGYVLMNIPYAEFYAAEGASGVDAVTSATKSKPLTGTLAGGSYHVNADGSDITGVIYPVYVSDPTKLAGLKRITDADSVDITVTNRGQTTTATYSGKDALFQAPSYSYYVLDEVPSYSKTLTILENGSFLFGQAAGIVSTSAGATAELTLGGGHADVEISLSGVSGIESGTAISGVVLTTSDGSVYGLRHVVNVWRALEIGWNLSEMDLGGKTITNIRYITRSSIVDVPVNIVIENAGYVLMNIPYADFYTAEGASGVDAVTSATKAKPLTGTLAGGSYHVNADGSDITGVIYPVLVSDLSALSPYTKVTDETSVDITVTNRGQTTTTTYSGKDALFQAPSYSYYVLDEKPTRFKVMTIGADGSFSFSAVNGRATTASGAAAELTLGGGHADVEISLSGVSGIESGTAISGVVLTTSDGSVYGLRHVVNVWRALEIGWNLSEMDLGGKTITNIRYITRSGIVDVPVEIAIGSAGYVLMNIPYADFYTAEGASGVDAVTSATKSKPLTGTLAGGSYHVNADGSDITGVIYPVLVPDLSALSAYTKVTDETSVDITVTNRGQTTTTTYSGKDALFQAPSYSYYVLDEKPTRFKVMTIGADGSFSFGAVNGRAATAAGATAELTVGARHAFYEIKLSSVDGIESGAAISGVVLTTSDGSVYGLRHVVNVWRALELGFNFDEFDLGGKTITNIRYITQGSVINVPVEIEVTTVSEEATENGLNLPQSYLLLNLNAAAPTASIALPENLETFRSAISWASDNEEIAAVNSSGTVTPKAVGTATIKAALKVDGVSRESYVRVDVVSEGAAVESIYLPENKAKVEVFSTDYARLTVIPVLEQNIAVESNVIEQAAETAASVAITGAVFKTEDGQSETENDLNQYFTLRPADDRTLEIIPTQKALELGESKSKELKTGYKNAVIAVTFFNGEEEQMIEAPAITITVKKTLPKVTAAAVKLNSFYLDEQEITFKNGTVSAVEIDTSKGAAPTWLNLDGLTVSYNGSGNANGRNSGKLNLLATIDGWAIKQAVTVSVSTVKTDPKMTFKPAALTLKPGTSDSATTIVTISSDVFLRPGFEVSVSRLEERNVPIENIEDVLDAAFDAASGTLVVKPVRNDGSAHTYKLYLKLEDSTRENGNSKEFPVTVKTLADTKAAVVTAATKAAGSIDTSIAGSPITLTTTLKNYNVGGAESYSVIIYENGEPVEESPFAEETTGNVIRLTAKDPEALAAKLAANSKLKYTAVVMVNVGADEDVPAKAVNLTVKSSKTAPKAGLKLVAKGALDVLRREGTSIVLTPTITNWYLHDMDPADLKFYQNKAAIAEENVPFHVELTEDGSAFIITLKKDAEVASVKGYSVEMRFDANGTTVTKTANLSIKMGAGKVSQSTKTLTLLKNDRNDRAVFQVMPADETLSGVAKVEPNAKNASYLKFTDLGNGYYQIRYSENENGEPVLPANISKLKSASLKFDVTLEGNDTGKANTSITVTVKFA